MDVGDTVTVVGMGVIGGVPCAGIVVKKAVTGIVGIGVKDVGAGVTGIRTGRPLSIKTDAEDWGFSALMVKVRVAVLDDVRNATTARPSRSVVTRA